MIDFSRGWDDIKERLDSLLVSINGSMTHFPLCCSTGVLQGVSASRPNETQQGVYEGRMPYTYGLAPREKLEKAESIRDLMRAPSAMAKTAGTYNPFFIFPEEVGVWYCLSLCRLKCELGTDEQGPGAYSGYKAAQITMFDRLLEDKDPAKGFKFQYNMVFSVDHFQQWLVDHGQELGDVYLSPAVVGAHGARVRGCIFTPDLKKLQQYEKERLALLRKHMLANYDFLKERESKKVTDKTAAMW